MSKVPLLLLHGALGEKHQFDSLSSRLDDVFAIHRMNFEGHGNAKDSGRPFRIEYFAENVLKYLDQNNLSQIDVFGYSMGGYVALFLAMKEPERFNRIATLGTILEWNEDKALTETVYLHPDKMQEKVPHFTKLLEQRHKTGWVRVVNKTREMLEHLGRRPTIKERDWRALPHPIRIHVGDHDTTANVESSFNIYNHLDHGELAVLPRTPHPLEQVNEKWLITSLREFFLEKEE